MTRQHVSLERREISKLGENFVVQPEQIEHKQAIRPMPAGTVVNTRHFIEPNIIKRGDKIVISAMNPSFTIRMNGLAMMDGTRGQVIRVKNQNSGRIISATVIEPGVVAVNY